jgi:hypothetical protein
MSETKMLTIGEFRKLTADLPADTQLLVSVQMNDETAYFPMEDICTDTVPCTLLCGEEVEMEEDGNGNIKEVL